MKRKLWIFSSAVIIITIVSVVSYSKISRATTHRVDVKSSEETFPGIDADTRSRIKKYGGIFTSWLNKNVPGGMVPSAAVGVIKDGELVYQHGVNADNTTRFGIASLSKTFTAVLTLKLAEVGILTLDDPVTTYLPQVVIERNELQSKPVTIRHLLAHTSGIPSYGSGHKTYVINGKNISLPRQVNPAGYCYAYSNESYVLVMHIIEAATGRSYEENLKEYIFDPLGMTSSTGEQSNGTGGIVTTINDLARYAAMLINRGRFRDRVILSEKSFNEMLAKPVELPSTKVDYHYSLSWEVITVDQKVDSYYKAGRWFGEASGLQVFPEEKIAFIYLCNPPQHLTNGFMGWRQGLTAMLRYLLRNISGNQKLCTLWPYLTPDELKWYQGEYINTISGERVKIIYKGGRLFSTKYGGLMPLRTFTSNRFLIGEGRMLHNFVWKDRRVIGLALRNGYYKLIPEENLSEKPTVSSMK